MMEYDIYARSMWIFFKNSFKKAIDKYCKTDYNFDGKEIIEKAKPIYIQMLKRTTAIGGMKQNPMTMNILSAIQFASIYLALDKKVSVKVMEKIYDFAMTNAYVSKKFRKKLEKCFTNDWQHNRSNMALKSQISGYEFDWKWDFIYGKTKNEYGLKFYKCGICKLYEKEGIKELVPAMCAFDFTMAEYMGAELTRTKTISNGDGVCDFWYKRKNKDKFLSSSDS